NLVLAYGNFNASITSQSTDATRNKDCLVYIYFKHLNWAVFQIEESTLRGAATVDGSVAAAFSITYTAEGQPYTWSDNLSPL
ncbi:hypothetical protein OQA88_3172, partial [Cercophora sp. LCS_1]